MPWRLRLSRLCFFLFSCGTGSSLQRWTRQRDEELAAAEQQFNKLQADAVASAASSAAADDVRKTAEEARARLEALRNEKVLLSHWPHCVLPR